MTVALGTRSEGRAIRFRMPLALRLALRDLRGGFSGFTIFLILAFLINVLGALCLIVGLLVTIPMTFAAITVAYREIVGFEPRTVSSL